MQRTGWQAWSIRALLRAQACVHHSSIMGRIPAQISSTSNSQRAVRACMRGSNYGLHFRKKSFSESLKTRWHFKKERGLPRVQSVWS